MKEITKHPVKWLALYPGEYAELIYSKPFDELGRILFDMIEMCLKDKEPEYPINDRTMARSHVMWDAYVTKGKRISNIGKDKYQKQKDKIKELETSIGIGTEEVKGKKARPTLEEVKAYFAEFGLEHAEECYNITVANDWHDQNGQPIRNWKAALKALDRNFNPELYNTPETAQQQEDI